MRSVVVATLSILVLTLPTLLDASSAGHDSIPTDRVAPGVYEPFDDAMKAYMAERGIHAGTLAVSYRGDILWANGYGTMTAGGIDGVPTDALMRIASVTKPITLAAVRHLITDATVATGDQVFCSPGQADGCWIHATSYNGWTDDRLDQVTVGHLMDHRGGWNRDLSGDPMFQAIHIANTLGVPSPPSQMDTVRYMMGQPLDHTPGTRYAYSNFGYLLLGLIIEQASGMDYVAFLKDRVFAPSLVDEIEDRPVIADLALGRTLPQDRDPREPDYRCEGGWQTRNVYDPSEYVCWPDGGWNLEAMEAHGGLVATSETIAWFLDHYWMDGTVRLDGQLPVAVETARWWFYGSLDGTWAMAYQHREGLNIAVHFNQRYDPAHGWGYESIRQAMDDAVDEYKTRGGCSGRIQLC